MRDFFVAHNFLHMLPNPLWHEELTGIHY